MLDEMRIQQLLENILESNLSAEKVCSNSPELLPEVKKRLRNLSRIEHEIEAIFPSPGPTEFDRRAASPDPEGPLPQIGGYEVESVLGRGGMGVVYKAKHIRLKRMVAVKMLLAGDYASPIELARFLREAEAVANLRHPHIVQIHDAGDIAGRP